MYKFPRLGVAEEYLVDGHSVTHLAHLCQIPREHLLHRIEGPGAGSVRRIEKVLHERYGLSLGMKLEAFPWDRLA